MKRTSPCAVFIALSLCVCSAIKPGAPSLSKVQINAVRTADPSVNVPSAIVKRANDTIAREEGNWVSDIAKEVEFQVLPPDDIRNRMSTFVDRNWFTPAQAFWILTSVLVGMLSTTIICCVDSARLSRQKLESMEMFDTMSYKGGALLSWNVFYFSSGTVWANDALWIMVRRLSGLTLAVALAELIIARDPSSLDPLRFAAMGSSLQLFVGFLLGFFLSSSVSRWLGCVNAFFDLFNAIRNLQMQLHALGVTQAKVDMVMRYGVVSAWLHNHSLKSEGLSKEDRNEAMEKVWTDLISHQKDKLLRVSTDEVDLLRGASDPASQIWLLVGSLIGRMAQDQEIPPMPSPTYGRIIQLVQNAQISLKDVRQNGFVQVPFVYTHTLAVIVHLNNIVAVVSFGLTLGACIGSIFVHLDNDLRLYSDEPHPHHILIEDFQDLLIQFFKCFFSPILYQACLEIGICIANPFSTEGSNIPTDRMFLELIDDINLSNTIANNPPLWDKPVFKKPA